MPIPVKSGRLVFSRRLTIFEHQKTIQLTLIKSISGIRGTIGGKPGDSLSPLDIVKFTSAYAAWVNETYKGKGRARVVIGRDARMSGAMVTGIVTGTLTGSGIDVTDLGISTTPTVEMAVTELKAQGGIILTASHNPKQWNALKLLNDKGEFISEEVGRLILQKAETDQYTYAEVDGLGEYREEPGFLQRHIALILAMPFVDKKAIENAGFRVVVDAINSSGAVAVPALLYQLGVKDVTVINGDMHGNFAHNPEPLPDHLSELSGKVRAIKAHLGISVDPDVDRLAFVNENGEMFGEEYTLVAVADYILRKKKGNTVSNLSSTRALRDVTEAAGGSYSASAVGEVNVVRMMKETGAVIGGEGNGGVIVPDLHYGRDALAGIAIFLSHLASSGGTMSALKARYPAYHISKNKIDLAAGINVDQILSSMAARYKDHPVNTVDGVKIEFGKEWVHLRKSNTEPIIRIYSESSDSMAADSLARRVMDEIREVAGS